MLRWSRYSLPQVQHGRRPLVPCNMSPGPDRLAYLEGMLQAAELFLAEGAGLAELEAWLDRVPFARRLLSVQLAGRPGVRARPDARAQVSFDPRALGLAVLDGRRRSRQGTTYLATGAGTASFSALCSALGRGTTMAELQELGAERRLLDALIARGHIEEASPPRPAPALRDTVTWLGHAAVQLESGGTTVWVDPLLVPDMVWGPADETRLFSAAHAEQRLFSAAGTAIHPRAPASLPPPDLVLLTHQDRDHVDLGVLACLPLSTRIVVPWADPARPWEVDLARLIHAVLGPERRVEVLRHGERLRAGAIEVEALPFRGEMPRVLPHAWNCYVLTGATHRLALLADSRLEGAEVDRLVALYQSDPRPLTLFAGPPRELDSMPGWREGPGSLEVFGCDRLWGWYLPPWRMFERTGCANLSGTQLATLRLHAGLSNYFPYAMGSTPWFRITDPRDAFHLAVSSLSLRELSRIEEIARAAGVALLPAKYGAPLELVALGEKKEEPSSGVDRSGDLHRDLEPALSAP